MESRVLAEADLQYWRRPVEAHLYFPPTEEQFALKDKKRIVRYYFDGQVKFLPEEAQKVKEFEEYLIQKKEQHPSEINSFWTQSQVLRFLEGDQFKFDKTLKSIKSHIAWMNTYIPPKCTLSVDQFLNSKITYFTGIDNRFRPILILNVYEINPKVYPLEQVLRGLDYIISKIKENFFLPGQVENMVIVQDLNHLGVMSLPISMIKNIIAYLMENYKSLLYRLYAVNCPSSVMIPWGMVKTMLDDTTVEKVSFEKTNEPKGLWLHANRKQIEQKFGGLRPNITSHWPPVQHAPQFTREDESLNDILLTKEKYKELYESGELARNTIETEFIQ